MCKVGVRYLYRQAGMQDSGMIAMDHVDVDVVVLVVTC